MRVLGSKPFINCQWEGGDLVRKMILWEDVKIPTYKPHTNHKRSSVRSHTLAPSSICDLSHSLCWRPLTDLGHIISVTYVCHPLWLVCGHRKGILTSPHILIIKMTVFSYSEVCQNKTLIRGEFNVSNISIRFAFNQNPLRLDYGGLGLVWQNCNISVI